MLKIGAERKDEGMGEENPPFFISSESIFSLFSKSVLEIKKQRVLVRCYKSCLRRGHLLLMEFPNKQEKATYTNLTLVSLTAKNPAVNLFRKYGNANNYLLLP